jgi:hypothetical protein
MARDDPDLLIRVTRAAIGVEKARNVGHRMGRLLRNCTLQELAGLAIDQGEAEMLSALPKAAELTHRGRG